MDYVLLFVSLLLIIVGIAGSILPILPSTPLAFFGVFLYKFSNCCDFGWGWVVFFALLSVILMGLNYYIPIYGAKKSGASKMSSYGTTIGLVVGLIAFPPFGFIIGALLGAFIGELIANRNNVKGAFKASLGSFVGFMVSTGLSLMACVAMLILVITNIGCDLR